jgi:DNA-binding response OmpR family regulator
MKTIVVIDDEFALADVLAATLSDAGYRVYTAFNGAQGLEVLAEHAPDIVLLDFMMPLLDGPGVLRAMRVDAGLRDVPVILMSAVPESTVRRRTTEYTAFLRKPFDFDAVIATIERLLDA